MFWLNTMIYSNIIIKSNLFVIIFHGSTSRSPPQPLPKLGFGTNLCVESFCFFFVVIMSTAIKLVFNALFRDDLWANSSYIWIEKKRAEHPRKLFTVTFGDGHKKKSILMITNDDLCWLEGHKNENFTATSTLSHKIYIFNWNFTPSKRSCCETWRH